MSDTSANDLWDKTCKYLKEVLHPDVYSRWIAVIEPLSLDDDVLTLAVDNDFYQSWLEENYLPLIKNAISTACESQVQINFTIKPHKTITKPEPKKKRSIRDRFAKRSNQALSLNPKFTFD